MEEILVKSNCPLCDEHKTMLGNLISCVKGIYGSEELESFTAEQKLELARILFEQFCLDNRTKMIQGFKQKNIKDING